MDENVLKKISKDTKFFEGDKTFNRDMADQTYKTTSDKITEISLKCSGYGYF